jgi:hypothetical protein
MVLAGAAGEDAGKRVYSEKLGGGLALSGYRFGSAADKKSLLF